MCPLHLLLGMLVVKLSRESCDKVTVGYAMSTWEHEAIAFLKPLIVASDIAWNESPANFRSSMNCRNKWYQYCSVITADRYLSHC